MRQFGDFFFLLTCPLSLSQFLAFGRKVSFREADGLEDRQTLMVYAVCER